MRRYLAITVLALIVGVGLGGPPSLAKEPDDDTRRTRVDQMYESYRQEFPGIAEVSADTLRQGLQAGQIALFDVRREAERRVSTLPRARQGQDIEAWAKDHPGQGVVVYCTIGYRSGKIVRSLQQAGITAYNLKGGILAWVHSGGPLEHDGTPTNRIHVYGRKWDLAPVGYEAVW